jgi:hypothetical protein
MTPTGGALIKPEECSHLAMSILEEFPARGFEIVKKA